MAFRFSEGGGIEQIGELAAGYAIGGAVGTALEPLLQALRSRLWAVEPNLPTDPAVLALLVRLGLLDQGQAAGEAAKSGVGAASLGRMVDALRSPPDTTAVLELLRRRTFDPAAAATALDRAGFDSRYLNEYLSLATVLLEPADLANARQQGFVTPEEQRDRSGLRGVAPADAELLYELAGLPPGIGEGLELLRRGEIDEARFAQYVREGHTKTKYTADLLALRYTPLSASVAAEALIRERISEDAAVAIAAKNGLAKDDFLVWAHMLGRPPGITEALTIINRGAKGPVDGPEAKAFFRDVVARSDVRTEYTNDLEVLRVHYPPLFQVERALTAGTVTAAIASDTLLKEGYPKEWVDAIVNAHANGSTAKKRDLSAAIVDALYEAGLETHPEAAAQLELLGYTEKTADEYLNLWAARRIVAELVRGVSLIRTRYVGWKIDRATAIKDLDALVTDGTVHARLLPMWDAEREANAPVLTQGEIRQGFKYGRFTFDEAMEHLQLGGWTADDALTLLWIEARGDPRALPAG